MEAAKRMGAIKIRTDCMIYGILETVSLCAAARAAYPMVSNLGESQCVVSVSLVKHVPEHR